jgi:hypothetical protein
MPKLLSVIFPSLDFPDNNVAMITPLIWVALNALILPETQFLASPYHLQEIQFLAILSYYYNQKHSKLK